METIKVSNKNNSLYVIISTAPFQEGEKCPQNKEDNRLLNVGSPYSKRYYIT